jgi:hypothetical protein
MTEDYLAEEPFCAYEPPRGVRERKENLVTGLTA